MTGSTNQPRLLVMPALAPALAILAFTGCGGPEPTVVGHVSGLLVHAAPVAKDAVLCVTIVRAGEDGERTFFTTVAGGRSRRLFATPPAHGWPQVPAAMAGVLSHDGTRMLFQWPGPRSELRLLDLKGCKYLWKTAGIVSVFSAGSAFSRGDARFVAVRYAPERRTGSGTRPELWLWDAKTGRPLRRIARTVDPDDGFESYGFSRVTGKIAFIETREDASADWWEADADGSSPRKQCRIKSGSWDVPAPSGALIASGDGARLELVDRQGCRVRMLHRAADGDEVTGILWSPDSKRVALAVRNQAKENSVVIVDATSTKVIGRWNGILLLGWYGDSRRVACARLETDGAAVVQAGWQ